VRYAFPDGTSLVVGSHVWMRAEYPAGKESKPRISTRCEKLEFDENGLPANLVFVFNGSEAKKGKQSGGKSISGHEGRSARP